MPQHINPNYRTEGAGIMAHLTAFFAAIGMIGAREVNPFRLTNWDELIDFWTQLGEFEAWEKEHN